jgi:hypothetical protein
MGFTSAFKALTHGSLNWDTQLDTDMGNLEGLFNAASALATGSNLNGLTSPGLYTGASLVNAPGGSANTFLIWENYASAGTQAQIAVDITSTAIWWRKCVASAWSAWRQLTDSSILNDSGWVTTGTGITAASGFTFNFGRYRVSNGFVQFSASVTKATAASATANAAGVVTAFSAAVMPAGLAPAFSNGVVVSTGSTSTILANGRVQSDGTVVITNLAPSQAVPVGGVLDLMGSYSL